MSEAEASSKSEEQGKIIFSVSFCPHLGVYHYKPSLGNEIFFDWRDLERGIEEYESKGDPRQAKFVADLTSWARLFPHKIVTFFEGGKFIVRAEEVPVYEEPEERSSEQPEPPKEG